MTSTIPFSLPPNYSCIKVVNSFEELVTSTFGPEVNAICWVRALAGDFDELAACFTGEDDIVLLDEELLGSLRQRLSSAGNLAIDTLLEDQRLLQEHSFEPCIECVPRYRRDAASAIIPTDVYSFHADSATVKTDTYLCSYNGPATEGLRNEEALRRIDIPETRAALQEDFEREGGDFNEWLHENCYDLHYAPQPDAVPFSFGIGNLWRIAVQYPGCPVPPCLHRAPETLPGSLPRLLLIS